MPLAPRPQLAYTHVISAQRKNPTMVQKQPLRRPTSNPSVVGFKMIHPMYKSFAENNSTEWDGLRTLEAMENFLKEKTSIQRELEETSLKTETITNFLRDLEYNVLPRAKSCLSVEDYKKLQLLTAVSRDLLRAVCGADKSLSEMVGLASDLIVNTTEERN